MAYDVIILDALMPSLDGVTLCRAARAGGPNVDAGILMVSARNTESETRARPDSGADDYVTKPFGIRELLARIGAILRRAERAGRGCCRRRHTAPGPLSLDVARRQAFVRGHRVDLTRQEFDMLHQLSTRPGHGLQPRRPARSTSGAKTPAPASAPSTSRSAGCAARSSSTPTTRS